MFINQLSARNSWPVWQFPMPYPFCAIGNDVITCKMWSDFIYWLVSPIHTFNIWTKIFSPKLSTLHFINCRNCSTPFSYSSLMRDAFIQLQSMFPLCCQTSLSYPSCMLNSLSSWKVWPYPIQEDIFIVDSYVKVYSLFLDLTKFWQHFALISKHTTWKWWHLFNIIKYETGEQNKMHYTKISSNLRKNT